MSARGEEKLRERQCGAKRENETHRGFPGSLHLFLERIERVDGSVSDHGNHRPGGRDVESDRTEEEERGGRDRTRPSHLVTIA
jgi:hypothetical protein